MVSLLGGAENLWKHGPPRLNTHNSGTPQMNPPKFKWLTRGTAINPENFVKIVPEIRFYGVFIS